MFDAPEEAFHQAMMNVYRAGSRHGYHANGFLQLVRRHGGLGAAKRFLWPYGRSYTEGGSYLSPGLIRFWELGIIELSVEALVVQDKWKPLFTDAERSIARERLARLQSDEQNMAPS